MESISLTILWATGLCFFVPVEETGLLTLRVSRLKPFLVDIYALRLLVSSLRKNL